MSDRCRFFEPLVFLVIKRAFNKRYRVERDKREPRHRLMRLAETEIKKHRIEVMCFFGFGYFDSQFRQIRVTAVKLSLRSESGDEFGGIARFGGSEMKI